MSTLHLRKKRKPQSPRQAPPSGQTTRLMRAGEGEDGTDDDVREVPHERHESATDEDEGGPLPSQRRVAQQAQRDIERRLQDTDCRSDHGEDSACPPRPKMPSS